MSAKKNTILNYFKKTTNNSSSGDGDAESKTKPSSNNESDDERKRETPSKHKNKFKSKKSPKEKVPLTFQSPYKVGDLVWAKLQGYPWWPSVVCEHPTERKFCKWDGNGNCQELHVQFIDKPPSRAWIREKYVKSFKVSDSNISKPADPKWHRSVKEAEKAIVLSPKSRLSLILSDKFMSDADVKETNDEVESEKEDDTTECSDPSSNKRKESCATPEEKPGKRRRVVIDSDSSDEEFRPGDAGSESESASSGVVSDNISTDEDPEIGSPPPKKKKTNKGVNGLKKNSTCSSPVLTSSPRVSDRTKSLLSSFAANDSFSKSDGDQPEGKIFTHLTFDFLKPDKIKDANKRPLSHPDYDPKTLHVPDSYKKSLTPALKQWWEVKAQHFDTILFFKVGKFYELYHMDAVVGVNELNLIYMKGDVAHSGFPEIAYGRYVASLVERGFKVARVEQTETPVMMEERCKKLSHPTKFDKVVKRELCQITSKGTKKYGFLDVQTGDANAAFLLAITEMAIDETAGSETEYGVCFVDSSVGVFNIGQFKDDRHRSRLRTLVSRYPPVQILYERRCLSTKSLQILKSCINSKLLEALLPKTQFWDSSQTLRFLAEGRFFKESDESLKVVWPEVLKKLLSEKDSLGLTANPDGEMAIKALGAIIWCLKECCMEDELLSMKTFEMYVCNDLISCPKQSCTWDYFNGRQNMILDGVTLKNLDVLQNSGTGTLEGSLISKLDYCNTLAGKRLLHHWVCTPLLHPSAINDRLDAIEDLMSAKDVTNEATTLLKKLPDLERLLSKIHGMGHRVYNKDHPDNRAIFYEDNTYSKRKITDFLSAIDGFKTSLKIVSLFDEARRNFKSRLLKSCITLESDENSGGKFPNFSESLEFLDNSFDHEKAKKDGYVIPSEGVDSDYDEAVFEIKQLEKELASYLEGQCKLFGCKLSYVGTARNRYQIEVPDKSSSKVTSKHELQGQRKGFKRYWTPEVKEMLTKMMSAEDKRDGALRVVMSNIFIHFSNDSSKWNMAVNCLATLDVLLSFSCYSNSGGGQMCRPDVIIPSSDKQPFLKIIDGRHPCISNVFGGGDFIPNDTTMGISESNNENPANLIMITGPNMGGKSTLLRQVGLIVIIAQMGCYVPAVECSLSPVDRIFTRLGANDRIMMGESTFFVELSETSATLQHANEHSLILMDELGRGTSTFDGMAIAYAVVNYFADKVACRTLFSTHYHHLVQKVVRNSKCKLSHMACLVENENDGDPTQETITFLYKLVPGACPKSYGFNAAKLAGMDEDVNQLYY
ncbi:DNA mismatch repair protein msh6 [Chamberlinius hualienensis]